MLPVLAPSQMIGPPVNCTWGKLVPEAMVADEEAVQPLLSVTVSVYVPAGRWVSDAVVAPVFHE
jgi:hypothetical protein